MESLPVELLCRVRFDASGRPMVPITGGPAGDRVIVEAGAGRFEGPRLAGEVLRTAPRFETGDERYRWLNRIQAVGIGRMDDSGIAYDLYELR